jgi:hypothetical protein
MKCQEINIIEYIEGKTSKEIKAHIEACKRCGEEVQELTKISKLISTHYAEGKRLEEELDKRLQNIDSSKLKKVPEPIIKKISNLRDKSLRAKLKNVIGKGKKNVEGLVEGLLTSRIEAMPASPKDITKTKKIYKKKKGK